MTIREFLDYAEKHPQILDHALVVSTPGRTALWKTLYFHCETGEDGTEFFVLDPMTPAEPRRKG